MFYIAVGLKPYHHIEIYDIRKYLSEKIIVSWNLKYKFKLERRNIVYMVKVREDLTGQKFGRLTVLYQTDDYVFPSNGTHTAKWHCKCDCGKECDKLGTQLTRNRVKSCGCLTRELLSKYYKKYNQYDLSGDYGIGYTLNTNKSFYFDLEDYDEIKDYCWNIVDGYVVSRGGVRFHRVILHCEDEEIDHINHKKYDNRKENLRICSHQQNMMNKKLYNNNTSGTAGVSWRKSLNKWVARIQVNNKRIHIGYFDDVNKAIKARKDAEIKYFGEYRYKNIGIKEKKTNE